jgi:DNA-binding GntR family transcriptional regulator
MSAVLEPQPAATSSSLTDQDIYERIVDAVLDHRLAPGTKLIEERLGEAFGVSRTRIRQVLVRLASEQIVVLTPNRGASVACPTPDDAREVFNARRIIELPIVEAFIAVATEPDFKALTRLIDEEASAREAGDRRSAIRYSGEFHLQIAERARNRTLERMLRELVSRTSLILMAYEMPDATHSHSGRGCGCDEHHRLLEAMRLRDAKAACRLMKRHLSHIEASLDFQPEARERVDLVGLLGS